MLKVAGLFKRYKTDRGDVRAVNGIDFEVAEGEVVTLLGPSGCGKTTVLRWVAGLEEPDGSTIDIDGVTVYAHDAKTNTPPHERPISMVFQSYAIWPHMSVYDNVAYPLKVGKPKVSKTRIAERVGEALSLVRIAELADRSATMLSGGQQQRVAVARALIREPKLLLLDEPLSNLDAKLREEMRLEFKQLFRNLNLSAVYVTHDLSEALVISDRVVVMNAGTVVQMGPPREVYSEPCNRFVADFMGAGNVMDGVVESIDGGRVNVRVAFGLVGCADTGRSVAVGSRAIVAVRPESLTLSRTPSVVGYPCRVETDVFLGSMVEYVVRVDEEVLRVRMPLTAEPFAPGDEVHVNIYPESCLVLSGESNVG